MGILERFRLDGKVALVTACKRRIGKGITLALAEAGADIIGVSCSLFCLTCIGLCPWGYTEC